MIDQYDELERAARAATQGEWEAGDGWVFVPPADGNPSAALRNILRDVPEVQANAAYIAAAQPSVVLELIERIRAAEAKAGEPEWWGVLDDDGYAEIFFSREIANDVAMKLPGSTVIALYAAPVDTVALAERVKTLEEALGNLNGDSLDAMMEVIGEGEQFTWYNKGKSAMRDWFLRRISRLIAREALGGSNE